MGDVVGFIRNGTPAEVLAQAQADAASFSPRAVMVVMVDEEGTLYARYNETLRADGAITMCELVKAMNVEYVLHGE